MKIFLSWSGKTSHSIALKLREWLPSMIQALDVYVSSEDIRKGSRWSLEVAKELSDSSFGILCIVPGNSTAPWLNFEAGAISKSIQESHVIPLLFGVDRSDLLEGPLAQFQNVVFDKGDVYKMLETINEAMEKGKLTERRLEDIFEVWWPKLEFFVESKIKNNIEPSIENTRGGSIKRTDAGLKGIEVNILSILSEISTEDSVEASYIAHKLKVSEQKAMYHLDELAHNRYVDQHFSSINPTRYSLDHKGREYLIVNNLLK